MKINKLAIKLLECAILTTQVATKLTMQNATGSL